VHRKGRSAPRPGPPDLTRAKIFAKARGASRRGRGGPRRAPREPSGRVQKRGVAMSTKRGLSRRRAAGKRRVRTRRRAARPAPPKAGGFPRRRRRVRSPGSPEGRDVRVFCATAPKTDQRPAQFAMSKCFFWRAERRLRGCRRRAGLGSVMTSGRVDAPRRIVRHRHQAAPQAVVEKLPAERGLQGCRTSGRRGRGRDEAAAARARGERAALLQRRKPRSRRRRLLGILDEALLDDDGEAASQPAAARGLPP